MLERAPTHLLALLALSVAAAFAPVARAQSDDDGTALTLRPWSWETTPAHLCIAGALRDARRANSNEGSRLQQRIVESGRNALAAQLDILLRGRVPETNPKDGQQVLSDVQRELLLSALAKMPPEAACKEIEARLLLTPDDPRARLGAIYALGTVGEPEIIERLVELTPRAPGGKEQPLPSASRDALRSAVATLLRRNPHAWPALSSALRRTDFRAASTLLDALRGARNPRSLAILLEAARTNHDLACKAASLVPVCGSSLNPETDREFLEWMRGEIQTATPAYARTLIMAVGTLDDGDWIPALIERLEDEDNGVRDEALSALRRISDLGLPGNPVVWRSWFESEARWHAQRRPKLRAQLGSMNTPQVVAAIREYSEHRTRRAEMAGELATTFDRGGPEVRGLVISVLQRLGSPVACGALLRLMADGDSKTAEAAWQALHTISGIELTRDLEQLREVFGRS